MIIGFSLIPTRTKIEDYLSKRMFSAVYAPVSILVFTAAFRSIRLNGIIILTVTLTPRSFQSPPQKTTVSYEPCMVGLYLRFVRKTRITHKYFIRSDLAPSYLIMREATVLSLTEASSKRVSKYT